MGEPRVEPLVRSKEIDAAKAGAWLGCSDCDCDYDCYDGKTRCIRLPRAKQFWRDVLEGMSLLYWWRKWKYLRSLK